MLLQAGVLEGILVLVFVAVISVKAMLLVVDCKYALTEKRIPESGKSRKKQPGNQGLLIRMLQQ